MTRVRAAARSLLAAAAALAAAGHAGAQCPNNVPHLHGTWRILPYQMPINPISATLLRSGKVLIIAGSENDVKNSGAGAESYRNALWDPTGTDLSSIVVENIEYDVFCSGTAQLPHGRTLTVGGTSDYSFTGEARASFFDPVTEEFAQSQTMADGRWYATATTLGDGRVVAYSGLRSNGLPNTSAQIYDLENPGAGWGPAINGPWIPPLFPRAFLLPSGKVFYTGHGTGSSANNGWIFDPAAGTWHSSASAIPDRRYGAAVILPLLPPAYTPKIMNLGGGPSGTSKSTQIIDMSATTPSYVFGPDMSAGRLEGHAVILPNGKVLACGGSVVDEIPDSAGRGADLYNPATNTMTSAGIAAYARLYHSTALLLPDATVAVLGSNPGDRGKYLPAIEIYTPPYLYDAGDQPITTARPSITSVPAVPIVYGGAFAVSYASALPIASAVLIRPGSSTHAFDMEQRLIGLCGASPQPPCAGAGTLALTAPVNGNVAPPGYYMLFLVDTAGVPSIARFVELGSFAAPPPEGEIGSPSAGQTITAGGSVFFDTPTVASGYSWVFPGGTPATSTVQTPGSVTFAAAGEYTVSLTVLDASDNSDPSPPTREIRVLPSSPDFHIEVSPSSRVVVPGESATYTVTVEALSGFAGTVTLSAITEVGFPAGVSVGGFTPPTIAGSGTSTLTMNTAPTAIPYAVSLSVKGVAGALSHTASTSLVTNLAPPAGLAATPSETQIALSWQPSAGATGYRVGRSPVSGGPYQTIACPSGTAYTDAGLAAGATYYYTASAVFTGGPNAGGGSAESAEIAAMTLCPVPAYAGAISAEKSGADTVWSWTAGGASAFDLVRGSLGTLRATGGDFTAALDAIPAGEAACLANDTSLLSLLDPNPDPPADEGVFTLLRPVATTCPASGTHDDGDPSQAAARDARIAASARACP